MQEKQRQREIKKRDINKTGLQPVSKPEEQPPLVFKIAEEGKKECFAKKVQVYKQKKDWLRSRGVLKFYARYYI